MTKTKSAKSSVAAVGAVVRYGGHDATFHADIFEIEGAAVVRAADSINKPGVLTRPASYEATHSIIDFPKPGFWRPDLGVFVVPIAQVKVLENS